MVLVLIVNELPLRDPDNFVSGQIHEQFSNWQDILSDEICGQNGNVLNWIKNGVNVHDFFKHFRGNFKGKAYDCDLPP